MEHRKADNMNGGRRIVHGTPVTPKRLLETLRGESFCVSFADPRDLDRCIELVGDDQILILDNGAFTHWRAGKGAIDRDAFWAWANAAQRRCPQAVAVIPDVINGTEEENLLEMSYALRDGLAEFPERTMSIWHLNESEEQLAIHLKLCNFVGMGSCAEFDVTGKRPMKEAYLARMQQVYEAREAIAAVYDRKPWIHLMRGLGIFSKVAWADSADSTNVAMNHNRYKAEHGDDRVRWKAASIAAPIQAAAAAIPLRRVA